MADTTLCSNCRTITTCLEMGCGQGRAATSSPVADDGRPGRVDVASNFTMLAELAAAEGNLREAVERKRNELCEGAAADDGLPPLPACPPCSDAQHGLLYTERQVRQAQREAYEAGRAAAVPDGWKLVPVEPTPEMLAAPSTVIQGYGAKLVYMRMIATAPQPPEKELKP